MTYIHQKLRVVTFLIFISFLFFTDGPVRLYRDVVLLTDDRNLRLKAHTHNVPVKDVPSFLHWSKVT